MKPEFDIEYHMDGSQVYFLKETWTDGTLCDVTGTNRITVVHYHCSLEEKVSTLVPRVNCLISSLNLYARRRRVNI